MKVLKKIVTAAIAVVIVAIAAGCSKDDVTVAKEGHLDFNKSITIGQALDGYKYFGNKEWLATKTPQGTRLVIFKADMNPQFVKEINGACKSTAPQKTIESQKWAIQFTLNKDNSIFVSGTQTLSIAPDKTKKAGSLSEALLQSVYKNELAAVCM